TQSPPRLAPVCYKERMRNCLRTWMVAAAVSTVLVACDPGFSAGNIAQAQSWTFDDDRPSEIAKGFSGELGNWVVVRSDNGNALAQTAKNSSSTFNITLVTDTHARDVDLSVKMKAVAGEIDQGGG